MHPGRRLAAFYPQDSHDRAKAEFCAGSSAACNAEVDECRTPRHRTRLRAEGRGRKVLADPRIALALRVVPALVHQFDTSGIGGGGSGTIGLLACGATGPIILSEARIS